MSDSRSRPPDQTPRPGAPPERLVACPSPLSQKFVGLSDLQRMLARQGPRPDGSKGEIQAAYLESYGRGDPRFGVIGAFWEKRLLGVSSFGVLENRAILKHGGDPAGRRKWYGRIDAVVVPPEFQGFSLSRLMMGTSLLYMLRTWPGAFYSLSCIAAHAAIAHILRGFGFTAFAEEEGAREVRMVFSVDERREGELAGFLAGETEAAARRARYRIRQRGGFGEG